MRTALLFVSLFVMLAAAIWWAVGLWMSVEGPPMPTTGYVAMWLGIIFSLVIGCGLMALMFFSSRRGYDERAQGQEMPPPDPPSVVPQGARRIEP